MNISHNIRDTRLNARVNSIVKHNAEQILAKLGVSMSETINALLIQIELNNGIPFDIKIPNKVTQRAMRDAETGRTKKYASVNDLLKELHK